MFDCGIHIFRRDLRLHDNHGLIEIGKRCKTIVPVFFLDPHQVVKSEHNKYYFSVNAVQFMCESLEDLNAQLKKQKSKLHIAFGQPSKLLANLLKQLNGSVCVSWNADYSRYSLERDSELMDVCKQHNAQVMETHTDLTLVPFENLVKSDGAAFKQFGAFYKNAIKTTPLKSVKNENISYTRRTFSNEFDKPLSSLYEQNNHLAQRGGRTNTLAQLKKKIVDYGTHRDRLDYDTTNISAGLNFGCISIREAYESFGHSVLILKQLYWRDFYLTAVKYLLNANNLKRHIDARYDAIAWKNNASDWEKIWQGRTGFLMVDAAMSQMRTTGYMHNRARMIVVVMWTKYLLINPFHPKYGSQVGYSRLLVDAVGPSQNQMNHRWADEFDFPGKKFSAPGVPLSGRPMDVSNKKISKWDPECAYIKKWLPHLAHVPVKDLVNWDQDKVDKYKAHVPPMFDSKEKYKEWIRACS